MARQVTVDPEKQAAWVRLRALRTLIDAGWVTYRGVHDEDTHVLKLAAGGLRYLGRDPEDRQYDRGWRDAAFWWSVGYADHHGAGESIMDLLWEPVPDMLSLSQTGDLLGMTIHQVRNAWRDRTWYPVWLKGKERHVFRADVEAQTAAWGLEVGVLTTDRDLAGQKELQQIWSDLTDLIPESPFTCPPPPPPPTAEPALDRYAIAAERRQESLDVAVEHGVIVGAHGGGKQYEVYVPRQRGKKDVRELTGDAVQPYVLGAMDAAGKGDLATYRLGL